MNETVDAEAIAEPHITCTVRRMAAQAVALCFTSLDYNGQNIDSLGPPPASIFATTIPHWNRWLLAVRYDTVLDVQTELCAKHRWQKLRGLDHLTKIITGIKFNDGVEVQEVNQNVASFNYLDTVIDHSSIFLNHYLSMIGSMGHDLRGRSML